MSHISTNSFKFAHGKLPKGYGSWAFQVKIPGGSETIWERGMYSECAKRAKKYFPKGSTIIVLS